MDLRIATSREGTLAQVSVNRRRFLALAGGAAGAALLAACGSGSKATATPIVAATKPDATTAAPAAAPGTTAGTQLAAKRTMIVEAGEYFFKTNGSIAAGVATIQLKNVGVENHEANLVRLNDGVTLDQFLAALKNDDGSAEQMILPVGGPGVIAPQHTSEVTLELMEGKHVLLCFVPNAEGTPHAALGMALPITITPAAGPAAPLPTDLATIALRDTGFAWPAPPPAGKSTFRVVNEAQQPLGLSILRILPGKTVDDVKQYFSGPPSGPFPIEGAGGMASINPGGAGIVSLDLSPGDYVAFTQDPAALQNFTVR